MAKRAVTRNKSILVTWFLGMIMFIDDYLNAIAIGNSMKKVAASQFPVFSSHDFN